MELSKTKLSCRQCGANLIHGVSIPPSPTPQLLHGYRVPSNHAEAVCIKSYISKVENILSILDADLAILNNAMEKFRKMREEVQRALVDHRSLLVPIRRLPNEILTEIFCLCSPPIEIDSEPLQKTTPFYLAQISSHWRSVVLSTPKLWSQINLSSAGPWNQSLMKEWIHHSGKTPLDIVINVIGELPQGDSKLESICRLLVAESRRWRTASISLSRPRILAYLQPAKGRLPLLESLFIWAYVSSEPPILRINFFANAPNLRRLDIPGFEWVDSLSSTFHGLTYLKIHSGCDSAIMWLDVLQACPNLIELDMYSELWWEEPAVLSHPMPIVCLRYLEKFNVEIMGEPEVLFDHLETPNIRQISVLYMMTDTWLTQPSFLSFLRRSSPSLRSMHISSCVEEGDVIPDVLECLRAVPGLTTLKLEDKCGWITDDAMENLINRANRPPLLPMLEELELQEYTIDPGLFADMVESRCSLPDTDSCRRLKQAHVRLGESPTFQPGSRQAWLEQFEEYKKQGLRISIVYGWQGEEETLL